MFRRKVLKIFGGMAVITGIETETVSGQDGTGTASDGTARIDAVWPRPGRDNGNRRYAASITGPESDIGVAYGAEFDVENVYRESAAVVSDNTVYMTTGRKGQKLYAFNAQDGSRKWLFEADAKINAPPAISNGAVYLPADRQYVYALDAEDGNEIWRTESNHGSNQQSAPVVADGSLYFTNKGGTYALNTDTGQVEWSQTSPSIDGSGSNIRSYFSPALRDDLLYVSGSRRRRVDGEYIETYGVFALSKADGSVRWTVETVEGRIKRNSHPVIADGVLYIGGNYDSETEAGGNLYALDPNSGEIIWRYDSPSTEIISAPAVSDSIAVVYLGISGIAAVDITDGTELWRTESSSGRWSTGLPTPAIANETVYVQAGDLQALNLTSGKQKWTLPNLEVNLARPSIGDGTVYIGTTHTDVRGSSNDDSDPESVTVSPGRLYALREGEQQIPDIQIQVPESITTGDTASFSASLSNDFDKAAWDFTWGIVDGSSVETYEGQEVTHQYSNSGEFELAVGISNGSGVGTAEHTQVSVKDGGVSGVVFRRASEVADNPLLLIGGGAATVGLSYIAYKNTRSDTDTAQSKENTTNTSVNEAIPSSQEKSTMPALTVNSYSDLTMTDPVRSSDGVQITQATVEGEEVWALTPKEGEETVDIDLFEEFINHIETWANMDAHPNLLTIYGQGSDPLPWIAVKPADKPSIRDRSSVLSFEEKISIIIQACEAIHHIQRYGLTYKHLSRDSVLLNDGKAILKGVVDHVIAGQDTYELPTMNKDPASEQADVYRLSALAYKVLTGTRPKSDLIPPSEHEASVPLAVDNILLKALSPAPADRHETVLHLRDDFQQFLE